MEKLKYWLKTVMGKQENYCKGFCPCCKYYEICKSDKSMYGERGESK